MGFISSAYYLKHHTVHKFFKDIVPGLSFKEMLRLLSDAEEFKETPLRHNEDIHNKELSDRAPYKAKNYGSPQDKTFLLLQMHFFNLPFPLRDYVNDCKLILDSSSRVIIGLIEVAKEKKICDAVLMGIYIQQAIYQGFGCSIPYITYDVWLKMVENFDGLAGIVEGLSKGKAAVTAIDGFLQKNVIEYNSDKKHKIFQALDSFPRMKMRVRSYALNSETNEESNNPIEEGGEAIISIEIQK